ncbi:MAG: hypothetical protein V1659_05035 [Candidatus Woesearchaeota archaeon]
MKNIYLILIPATMLTGLIALFFFPEPENNFLAYCCTALLFTAAIVFLVIKHRREK